MLFLFIIKSTLFPPSLSGGRKTISKHGFLFISICSLHRHFQHRFSASLGSLIEASKLKDCNISPDSSLDGEFEFDHNSESEDENEDSDIEENMKKVIKHDDLGDSGCGQGFEEEFDGHKTGSRRKVRKTKASKLNDYAGADALLSLANSACSLTSSREGSQTPSPVVSQSPTCVIASS